MALTLRKSQLHCSGVMKWWAWSSLMTTPSSAESRFICERIVLLLPFVATTWQRIPKVTIVIAYFCMWLLTSDIFGRWCSEAVATGNGETNVSYCVKSSRGEPVVVLPQVRKIHYSVRLSPMCLCEELKLRLRRLLFTQNKTTWFVGNTSLSLRFTSLSLRNTSSLPLFH